MNISQEKREDTLKIPVPSKKSRSTGAYRTTLRIKSLLEAFISLLLKARSTLDPLKNT